MTGSLYILKKAKNTYIYKVLATFFLTFALEKNINTRYAKEFGYSREP